MMRAGLAVIALLLPFRAGADEAATPKCPPAPIDVDSAPLSRLAAALKPGGKLSILALGSSPVPANPDTSGKPPAPPGSDHSALPWQLADALEARVHKLAVDVTVRGGHGLDASQLLPMLQSELRHGTYQLVLWQTGTVDAVHGVPPGDFYQSLMDGAAAVAAAGADLVLIDMQYSRFLEANANLAPYQASLQAAGSLPGAVLFHRFEIMHDWVDQGAIDLEQTPKTARRATMQRLHACLGQLLARTLLADIAAASE